MPDANDVSFAGGRSRPPGVDAADPPGPGDGDRQAAPPEPRQARTVRRAALVAFIAVLASLLGIAIAALPLSTPTQDCGTALTFLLEGGIDEPVDPANPPDGITREQALANNERPCQERAAGRARPGGALLIGGMVVALGALATEQVARYRYRRARRRARPDSPER